MPIDDDMPEKPPTAGNARAWAGWLWPMILPLLGGSLLLPWEQDWPHVLAVFVLWTLGGFVFVCLFGAGAFLASDQIGLQFTWTRKRRWFRPMALLYRMAYILGLVIAPLAAGRPFLAGCFAMVLVMLNCMPDPPGQDTERDPSRPRRVSKAFYLVLVTFWRSVGWCLQLVAKGAVSLGVLAVAAWDRIFPWRNRRLVRRVRAALGMPVGAVYFVYAEQHQYDRFLGPGGVLQSAIGRVVLRNWRRDLTGPRDPNGTLQQLSEAERELLERYKISNMREHLPFAVVFGNDDELHAFHLSKAYRNRRRDGGATLRDAENRLRLFIAVTD